MAASAAEMAPSPPASRSIAASVARARRRIAISAADFLCLVLAVARRRLSRAADAFICLYLASVWLVAAGVAAVDVGRVACGDDCPLTVAAYMVAAASGFSIAIFSAPATLLFLNRVAKAGTNADLEKVSVDPIEMSLLYLFIRSYVCTAVNLIHVMCMSCCISKILSSEAYHMLLICGSGFLSNCFHLVLYQRPAGRNFNEALQEVLCYTVMLGMLASMPFLVLMIVGGLLGGDSPVKADHRVKAAPLISSVGALGKDALYCFIVLPTFSLRVWKVTRPGWGCGTAIEVFPNSTLYVHW